MAFEKKLKTTKTALARKGSLSTMRDTFVVVLDSDDDVCSFRQFANDRRALQANSDFEAWFKSVGTARKEAVADLEG